MSEAAAPEPAEPTAATTEEGHPVFGNEQGEPEWFCDQCGARYFGPGVCQNGHAPTELKKIADVEAADESEPDALADNSPQSGVGEPPASAAEPATASADVSSAADAPTEPAVTDHASVADAAAAPVPPTIEHQGEDAQLSPVEKVRDALHKALDALSSLG